MAENITRCPECKTSFRISETILRSAKGAVRCGSCLKIFNAKENLIGAKPSSEPQVKRVTIKKITPRTPPIREGAPSFKEQEKKTTPAKSHTPQKIATTQKAEQAKENHLNVSAASTTQLDPHLENNVNAHGVKASNPLLDDDDILISDDMDIYHSEEEQDPPEQDMFSHAFSEGMAYEGGYKKPENNLFEREKPQADVDNDDSDESWALDLLKEDSDNAPSAPSKEELDAAESMRIEQEFEESFNQVFQASEAPKTPAPQTQHPEISSSTSRLSEEEYSDEYGIEGSAFSPENYDNKDINEELETSHVSTDSTTSEEKEIQNKGVQQDITTQESLEAEQDTRKPYERSANASHYLKSIEAEPMEFDWDERSSNWRSTGLWTVLSVIFVVLLAAQFAITKFDTWSLKAPYRPYYAQACELLHCELPELSNRKKIRTANLVVRTHPSTPKALVVDAILQNTANFEQTFPQLDLVFTDRREQIVAARRLSPQEYLTGELSQFSAMPIKQPIHIEIEIADPGKEAIGYQLSIVD